MTILPEEGAIVPRNARITFLGSVRHHAPFAMRPTTPAELRHEGRPVFLSESSAEGLVPAKLVPGQTYEVWLPDRLPPPTVLARARSFRVGAEDDTTPPRIVQVGPPVHLAPGPTSCGPSARIELAVTVEDASPVYLEVAGYVASAPRDRTERPMRVPISEGRITFADPQFLHVGPSTTHATYATHLVLTAVDIAGNHGDPVTVDLHRLADGGAAPPTEELAPTGPRGCGKF